MAKKSIVDWAFFNDGKQQDKCLLCLPGRGGTATGLAGDYYHAGHLGDDVLIVGVTPDNHQWYPAPFGPANQADAVAGIKPALQAIEKVVSKLGKDHSIRPSQIAIAGFSAGGVIALHSALRLSCHVACGVVHNGAALEPAELNDPAWGTKLMVLHNRDDGVFNWETRYLPTKAVLEKNNLKVQYVERRAGGHHYSDADLKVASRFILQSLEGGEGN